MDDKEVGRRVRAARWYKGLRSVPELAAAINEPGLKATTLYAIEQGRRHAVPRELAAIAQACELPVAFFRMDFAKAGEPVDEHDLKLRIQNLETQTASVVETISRFGGRLSQLDERLRLLETDAEAREWEADERDAEAGTSTARPRRQRPQ